jgi:transmembrane sensor
MRKMKWSERFSRRPRSAHEWFARLRTDEVSAEIDMRFRDWLTAERQNEQAFERQELAWDLAAELRNDSEIESLVREAERAARASLWGVPASLLQSPGFLAAGLGGAIAVAIVSSFLWLTWNRETVYTTAIGEQRTVVLPDGSQVTLNTATRVRIAYTRAVRHVKLEYGEATFAVVHNAARPFEVIAANGIDRDLGTQFNVLSEEGRVAVSVMEGLVQVELPKKGPDDTSTSAVLAAGQEIDYSVDGLSQIHRANLDRIEAWHRRRVAFDDVSLATAVAEFNRYSQIPLTLGDPALARLRVTGVFRVGETKAFINALDAAFGTRAQRSDHAIILLSGSGSDADQSHTRP